MKVSFSAQTPAPIADAGTVTIATSGTVTIAPPDTNTGAGIPSRGPAAPVIDIESELVKPAGEIPTAPASAVATIPATAAVATVPDSPIEFDENDIRFEDIYLPRVNIVHRVGDLSLVYEPGQIVLNQSLVIHTPANADKKITGDAPLNLTVVGFRRQQFVEKVAGGGKGLLVNSEAEVVAHNGTLAYKEWEQSVAASKINPAIVAKKRFEIYATALVIIQCPVTVKDEGHINFPYECEGKWYGLALWGMKGTAYTGAAKHFYTAKKIQHLKNRYDAAGNLIGGGYTAWSWFVTTEMKDFDSGVTPVPVVRHGTENTPAFRAFVKDVTGCAGK